MRLQRILPQRGTDLIAAEIVVRMGRIVVLEKKLGFLVLKDSTSCFAVGMPLSLFLEFYEFEGEKTPIGFRKGAQFAQESLCEAVVDFL